MDHAAASTYIERLYEHILHRAPEAVERDHWIGLLLDGMTADAVFQAFVESPEYLAHTPVKVPFPAGHFHSPIVDPPTVGTYVARSRAAGLAGIDVPAQAMLARWRQFVPFVRGTPFTAEPTPGRRYYFNNPVFAMGDATTLRLMLSVLAPKRIIEVGSGFSTACMLDTLEELHLDGCTLTCIDPDPVRLHSLLRPTDFQRVTVLEQPVQSVPLDLFASLAPNDLLFIDSTHILKTGSDVHYELFEVLPSLQRGVAVQIHDMHYPFEYPDPWIFDDNLSWNEIYAVRAFLMYNSAFRITFWNSGLAALFPDDVGAVAPQFLINPGGSLWLEKC